MSLGGGFSSSLNTAVTNLANSGVFIAVAAGNSNADLATSTPAAYDEVLTVTAMADFNGQPGGGAAATCRADGDDTAADFSNFATTASDVSHTIAAPGVCIKSTWKGGGYNTISGTSMASPHVTGVAALCIAAGPCALMTPAEVMAKLRTDASAQPADYGFAGDPNAPSGNRYYGHLVYAGGY
jgi:subtilisin family serine protease